MTEPQKIRQLERASRHSAVVSILGLAILVGAIIFGYYKISAINDEISKAESNLHLIESRRDSVQLVLSQLYEDFEQVDSVRAVRALSQAIDSARTVQITPRIYIHIANEQQRERARNIGRVLEKAGYIVPGVELVSNSPSSSELRYFRRSEEEEARKIVSRLGDAAKDVGLRDLSGRYGTSTAIRPMHYELWFSSRF